MQDSHEYKQKKEFFQKLITLYGRNVVVEVLQDKTINIYKLHLAQSNKYDNTIKKIIKLAKERDIEILYHDRDALSRISKNKKQDQGVAVDIDAHSINTQNRSKNSQHFALLH